MLTRNPLLLPLLPALLFLPVVLSPPLNQDVAGVLDFSQRWLAGEHLYTSLIDVNPPLIFMLNLIPAAIARVTPLDSVIALQMSLFAYGGLCWWLSLLARDRDKEGPAERAFLDVLPALFLCCAGYDFGQREHLMAMAALPYALAATRRARGEVPPGRVAIGLLAGVAFALKPHFLGVPALVEIYVLLARRNMRGALTDPLPWSMAGVWAAYLVSLPLLFPAYIGQVLPLVWSLYLDLGGTTVWQVMRTQRLGTAIILLMPLLCVVWRGRHAPRTALPAILALMAVAALAAAVVQHKGWSYHILPLQVFACALGGILAAQWFDRLPSTRPVPVAAMLTSLFALYVISNGEAPWRQLNYPSGEVAELADRLEEVASGGRVLALSPDVYPVYPALNYAEVRSTLRTMSTWLLQGLYPTCPPDGRRYREVSEMGLVERTMLRGVAQDFARAPPAAVLVDTNTGMPWCGRPFDFIEYFTRDPLFAGAWSKFRKVGEWGHFRLYAPTG